MAAPIGWNGAVNGIPVAGLQTGALAQPTSASPLSLFESLGPLLGAAGGTPSNALMSAFGSSPLSGTATLAPAGTAGNGAPQSRPGGGLINTASNFQFPVTSSLLQSLYQTPQPYTGPDYSQIALQMAGNPHAGPYAQVAPPSGVGIPGPDPASSGSSSGASTTDQIVGTTLGLLSNPTVAKGAGTAIKAAYDWLTSPSPDDLTGVTPSVSALAPAATDAALATLGGAPLGAAVTGATDAAASALMPGITSDFASTIGADTAANLAATDAAGTAGSGAATGSGLGALGGTAAAAGIAAVPLLLAAFGPNGAPPDSYYQGMLDTVAKGKPTGPQILSNGAESPDWADYNAALGELQNIQGDSGGLLGNGYSVPDWVYQQMAQLGIPTAAQTAAQVNAAGGARGGGKRPGSPSVVKPY